VLFASAFFFCNWLAAQYFRVRKQARVETDLADIQRRVATVLELLANAAADLTNRVTGGAGFLWARLTDMPTALDAVCLAFNVRGPYPLYDLRATIETLGRNAMPVSDWSSYRATTNEVEIGMVAPGQARVHVVQVNAGEAIDLAIHFYGRNGSWTQVIVARKAAGKWRQASRIIRDGQKIDEQVDQGFPIPAPIPWPETRIHSLEAILATISQKPGP
jgi:hypothetical protein